MESYSQGRVDGIGKERDVWLYGLPFLCGGDAEIEGLARSILAVFIADGEAYLIDAGCCVVVHRMALSRAVAIS